MTKEQFLDKHGAIYNTFLSSEAGRAFLAILSSAQPPYEFPKEEHLYADNRGCKRGYDLCIRNIIALSFIQKPLEQPEANYGVPDK